MNILEKHNEAMDIAEQAFKLLKSEKSKALALFEEAYLIERKIADSIEPKEINEPSRSIFYKSASFLALNARLYQEAEMSAKLGLEGFPSEDLANELKDIFDQINIEKHLDIKDDNFIGQEKNQISEQEYEEQLKKQDNLISKPDRLSTDYENFISEYDKELHKAKILQNKLAEKQGSGTDKIIKILFLSSENPIKNVILDIVEEQRRIKEDLTKLDNLFELKFESAITAEKLRDAMLQVNPTIIHISGHGSKGKTIFRNSPSYSKLIEVNIIENLFKLHSNNIKCVILDYNYSETLAQEISKYIPYVVGMRSSLNDKAATEFTFKFYTALGAGNDIPSAYEIGVVAVKFEGVSGKDIPVLLE